MGDDDDGSNFKQKYRYSQPKKQIPPNYSFSLRNANTEQRRSVNYDKPKQSFSTYSEFSNDERQIDPMKEVESRRIAQLKRKRKEKEERRKKKEERRKKKEERRKPI